MTMINCEDDSVKVLKSQIYSIDTNPVDIRVPRQYLLNWHSV